MFCTDVPTAILLICFCVIKLQAALLLLVLLVPGSLVWQRWQEYEKTDGNSLDWWLVKSPMFYAEDELIKLRDEYWRENFDK